MGRVLMPNGMRGFGMRRGPAKLGGALMPRAPRSGKSPDAPGPAKQGRALMPGEHSII